MTKLEDLLLPPNILKKKEELNNEIDSFIEQNFTKQEIDAIIDDGGITGVPLTLDEISELEYRNYPNAAIDEAPSFLIPEDVIEEQRELAELGMDDYVKHLEDDEHYVDHEDYADQLFNDETFQGSELQKSLLEFEDDLTKAVSEEIDKEIAEIKLPLYLMSDAEIVGYPDEEFQEEIYDWVNAKLPKHNFSVKDLGAGRGDFYGRLINPPEWEFSKPSAIDYFGIESNPNLCRVGEQKYPGIKLICNDFNDVSIQTDYTICIGTLNDDHGFNKWDYFNKTLNHSLSNTKTAILFVLQGNCYGESGHLDYPIPEVVHRLLDGKRYEIDNSRLEDIYLLTVHIGGYN